MNSSLLRVARAALVAMCLALVAVTVGAATPTAAQVDPPPAREVDPIFAIVSPVANPVCELSGNATLLVPVLSGLLADNGLDLGGVSLGDIILDSLGPVYMVCGTIPPSPNSTCELDREIASMLPEDVTSLGLPPTLLGDLADLLDGVLGLLGLVSDDLSVGAVLECSVAGDSGAPEAPPAPPAPPSPDAVVTPPSTDPPADPPAPSPSPQVAAPVVASPAPVATPSPVAQPNTPTNELPVSQVANVIERIVPGWIHALQIVVAVVLAAFLGSSWLTSLRIRRT